MTFLTIDVSVPEAEGVEVTDDTLTAELSDGRSISVPLAWYPRLAHRIRETWRDQQPTFAGPIEVDETFVEGKQASKHSRKKLRDGRGKVGKIPVDGVRDRATGKVSGAVIPDLKRATLQPFVESRTVSETRVYPDESWGCHGLPNREVVLPRHRPVG